MRGAGDAGLSPAISKKAAITLRITILASGSSGNATLVETETTCLLLDAGIGRREILRRFEALGRGEVVEVRVVGEVHELGDGERVELQPVTVAISDRREQLAVVIQREVRVEAAVEAGEIAAEGEQFVELGEDLVLREDVSAGLAGELICSNSSGDL